MRHPPPTVTAPLPAAPPPTQQALTPIAPGAPPPGPRRLEDFRGQRQEVQQGGRTIITEPGRIIVRDPSGQEFVRHDELDRFRYGAQYLKEQTSGPSRVNRRVTVRRITPLLNGGTASLPPPPPGTAPPR